MRKKTIEEVREFVESQGYELVSDVYKNTHTKLKMICPEGHEFDMTYNIFKNKGCRCPQCSVKIVSDKHRLSYDTIKKSIENDGYKLLSDTYINVKTKLDIMCPEGHKFEMTYNDWNSKNARCPICSVKIVGDKLRLSYNEVKKYIEDNRYKLLSDIYVDSKTKMKMVCPDGHEFNMSYNHFQKGNRCPICSLEIKSEKRRTPYEEVKEYIENQGYKLLSKEYVNTNTKLKMICPDGHNFEMIYSSFKGGHRCPVCNISKGEEEVRNILENYKVKYKTQYKFNNCRNILPLPFDFYIPDMNICIEYDGKQHFEPIAFGSKMSEEELQKQFKDVQLRDQIKTDYCRQNGIKLIRIPYTEFDNIEEILIKELNLKKVV